jgi:hypothetical protein
LLVLQIAPGAWYPINLLQPPFHLDPPLRYANEGYEGTDFYGVKRLGLWALPLLKPEEA